MFITHLTIHNKSDQNQLRLFSTTIREGIGATLYNVERRVSSLYNRNIESPIRLDTSRLNTKNQSEFHLTSHSYACNFYDYERKYTEIKGQQMIARYYIRPTVKISAILGKNITCKTRSRSAHCEGKCQEACQIGRY